jgi:hypothetical protein
MMGEKPILKVGWWVAITLKPNLAPHRCYVGQIEALTHEAIRLTLVDWIDDQPRGWGFVIPWVNVGTILLATEQHNAELFMKAAGDFQTRMEPGAPIV